MYISSAFVDIKIPIWSAQALLALPKQSFGTPHDFVIEGAYSEENKLSLKGS
jgi:hypothetical protein